MCDDCAVLFSEMESIATSAASWVEKWCVPLVGFSETGALSEQDFRAAVTNTLMNMGHIPEEIMRELVKRTREQLKSKVN